MNSGTRCRPDSTGMTQRGRFGFSVAAVHDAGTTTKGATVPHGTAAPE